MKKATIDFPEEYLKMSKERKESLKNWIENNFYSRKTMNNQHTSYGLKHILERDTGMYFTNDEFKGGMIEMGYTPHDTRELNWRFNISERSINDTTKRINNKNKY